MICACDAPASGSPVGSSELDRLTGRACEEKLLGTIDEPFWKERTSAWQHERDELRAEFHRHDQAMPREEFLTAARGPVEPPTRGDPVR
jgi:hypothetical protein